MTTRVAINGFGRIGRQVFKAISQYYADTLEVVAINDLTDNETLAYLLRYDSVHGRYSEKVTSEGDEIVVGKRRIKVLAARDPSTLPWEDLGVQFVLESTGIFRSREKASKHFEAGAEKVLISAPAQGAVDATIVLGVNDEDLRPDHRLITNASCTTNCAAVMLKILNDRFGVDRGMMTVIHAYTNDQSLHDQPHEELRRARAAAVSLIPASTGSSSDVGKVIPKLKGKLTSVAIRTPNICGSIVDLVAELEQEATVNDVNLAFYEAAQTTHKACLEYTDDHLVSIDVIGNPASCILDSRLTMMVGKKMVKIMGWFDNEWGYSVRCADLFDRMARLES